MGIESEEEPAALPGDASSLVTRLRSEQEQRERNLQDRERDITVVTTDAIAQLRSIYERVDAGEAGIASSAADERGDSEEERLFAAREYDFSTTTMLRHMRRGLRPGETATQRRQRETQNLLALFVSLMDDRENMQQRVREAEKKERQATAAMKGVKAELEAARREAAQLRLELDRAKAENAWRGVRR